MLPTKKPVRKVCGASLCTIFTSFCVSIIISKGREKWLQNSLLLCHLMFRITSPSDHFYFLSAHIIPTLILPGPFATLLSILLHNYCISLDHEGATLTPDMGLLNTVTQTHRNRYDCLLAVSYTEILQLSQSSVCSYFFPSLSGY